MKETLQDIILTILLTLLLALLLSSRSEAASLFEDTHGFTEENEGEPYIKPSYSDIPEEICVIPEDNIEDHTVDNALSVSGGDYDAVPPAAYDISALSDDLIELYTINQNVANQYLSSAVVAVFDKAVSGASYGADYVAWRDDTNDSNSGYLLIGKGKANGINITFEKDAVLCHYYRTWTGSSNYQYNYSVTHTGDTYSINFANRLIYTNLIEGYPILGDRIDSRSHLTLYLIFGIIAVIVFIIMKRR